MARKKWRGYADFEMPEGATEALMTVCPGNPDQEGQKFKAIMEAAGAKLDHLYIIEAGDLGYHNLKRLVPKNEAKAFARLRGQRWLEEHKQYIDEYMDGRCTVIPMADIVADNSYEKRIELIHDMYERGDNPVTKWFNYSLNLDIDSRARRKEKDGVIIKPWAIKENALDYLCDEYAMRSLMWQQFKLEEIYLGLAVSEHDFFQRENTEAPEIDLTIPQVRPIYLEEVKMVHIKELGCSVPALGKKKSLPRHARSIQPPVNVNYEDYRQSA